MAIGAASGSTGAGWTSWNEDEADAPGVQAMGVDSGLGTGVIGVGDGLLGWGGEAAW